MKYLKMELQLSSEDDYTKIAIKLKQNGDNNLVQAAVEHMIYALSICSELPIDKVIEILAKNIAICPRDISDIQFKTDNVIGET